MTRWKTVIVGMLITATLPLLSQGYGLYEQGVQGFGNLGAYAARAEDASALYHNPAGLALLTSSEIAISGRALFGQSFYSNPGQSTWDSDAAFDGTPSLFTNFSAGKFAFGLGSTITHHYQLDWDELDFPARFLGKEHEVRAFEHMGGLSYRFNDYFSIGATWRQADLEMTHSRLLPRPVIAAPDVPFETEDRLEVDGTGDGFSVGFLYYKPRRFSIGVTYWSPIEIDLEGTRSYSLYNPLNDTRAVDSFDTLFGSGAVPATTALELPERITAGFQAKMTVRIRLEVDLSMESWSSVETLAYQTQDVAGQPEQIIFPRNWEDTFSYRIAGDFQQRKALLWRAALGGTDSVVPDESLGPDFPDYERFMYSFGVSYTLRRKYVLEAGWTYIQNRDRPVNDQELFFDPSSPDFYSSNGQDGVYETQRMQFNLGLRIKFGKQRKAPER